MSQHQSPSFTLYGWLVCVWVLISPFQYGFHISVLNQVQAVLTCRFTNGTIETAFGLPTCIPMTDAQFSAVTASFTVGGLLGSLVANIFMERGRKSAIKLNALLVIAGAGLMTISSSIAPLLFGRLLTGIGAGIGICVGPVFVGEIAPTTIKGSVGVLTQLSIVFGILITQAMGMYFATPRQWRFVLLFSAALSLAHYITSPLVSESPAWLDGKGRTLEVKDVSSKLWGSVSLLPGSRNLSEAHEDLNDPLLAEEAEVTDDGERLVAAVHSASITVPQLLKAPELRRPLLIVSFAMMAQQFSGINAVLYYSNAILSKALPDAAAYVSLGITVVNALMTFPPIFLIEGMGRKSLLIISIGGSFSSLLLVGYGLDSDLRILSCAAIVAFVASFACGLGPVPFVIISDVSPFHAISALSSVALSLNLHILLNLLETGIVNFIVGLLFLPLRNFLASGDPLREGRVFYVFAGALGALSFVLSRVYKG